MIIKNVFGIIFTVNIFIYYIEVNVPFMTYQNICTEMNVKHISYIYICKINIFLNNVNISLAITSIK